jgi:hypothetical protein
MSMAAPGALPAGEFGHGTGIHGRSRAASASRGDMRSRLKMPARLPGGDMRSRLKMPARLPAGSMRPGHPAHPICPADKPCRPGNKPCRPGVWWPVATSVAPEPRPIVIVNHPPAVTPTPPPPEPQQVWVPPVMGTRMEPGYWDYGIKKSWMGDHWRYEQDFDTPAWVPESEVQYVKQEGYWKNTD